jgi:hypothetical protein
MWSEIQNGQEPELSHGTDAKHSGQRSAISTPPGKQNASGANIPAPLAICVKRAGMLYRQIFREGDVAIYCTRKGDWIEYEVFKIQILRAGQLSGRNYPDRESFPSSSAWGTLGFTHTTNSHRNPDSAAFAKAQTLLGGNDPARFQEKGRSN